MVYKCIFPIFSLSNTMIEKFKTCLAGLSEMVATFKVLDDGKIELILSSYKKDRFSGAFWFLQANFEEIKAIQRISIANCCEPIIYRVKLSNGNVSDYMYDGCLVDVNDDGSCIAEIHLDNGFGKMKQIKIKKGNWFRDVD